MKIDNINIRTSENWEKIAHIAQKQIPLKGSNNNNYIVNINGILLKIRIPIPGRLKMDIHRLPESVIQQYLNSNDLNVPIVYYHSNNKQFDVHQYLPIPVVDSLYPRGTKLPDFFIYNIVEFLSKLYSLPTNWLSSFFTNWATNGDTSAFLKQITNSTIEIYHRYFQEYHELFLQLGIPENIVDIINGMNIKLYPRPFSLCHCDIHRKNCLIENEKIWVIDWENAILADPAYDIGVHLSKMEYLPNEEDKFIELITKKLNKQQLYGLVDDYKIYKNHEYIKSIIVHAIRYHHQFLIQTNDKILAELANKYRSKLAKTEQLLGNKVLSVLDIKKIFSNYNINIYYKNK